MARQKKKIIVACSDEVRLSLRVYLLNTHGYDTFAAADVDEVRFVLGTLPADLLLIEMPLHLIDEKTIARLQLLQPELRVLVLSDAMVDELRDADVLLAKIQATSMEVLWRVKVLTSRKRGPKAKRIETLLLERRAA